MPEAGKDRYPNYDQELEHRRLLSDVDHLVASMMPDRSFPVEVEQDILTNKITAVHEGSMPEAVSVTVHRVEYVVDERGRKKRLITWLGKSAVEVAASGREFHRAPAALSRVEIEEAEAVFAEDSLKSGKAQVFISPKMTADDAPREIARAEHLADEDSVRVTYAIKNRDGEVVARRLESLLVTGIDISAWVAMFKDPQNIFGKSFNLSSENSALSVMELFKELVLDEEDVPEGPVTMVEAVLPYVDQQARPLIEKQIANFRKNQSIYNEQAISTADEWLAFDKDLACSLVDGVANFNVKRFIVSFQDRWNDEDLATVQAHQMDNVEFKMTRELAAILESAKQRVLLAIAGVAVGSEKIISQTNPEKVRQLQTTIERVAMLRANNMPMSQINAAQTTLERDIADTNITPGGGCLGGNKTTFQSNPGEGPSAVDGGLTDSESDKKKWKWKIGICQVKRCPSPKPTEVGPCTVCRRCQSKFDAGQDPTKSRASEKATERFTDKLAKLFVSKPEAANKSAATKSTEINSSTELVREKRSVYALAA